MVQTRSGIKADNIHSGDQPLKDALLLILHEGISSLPVLDAHKNVIGNISHVDIKVSMPPTNL